MAAGLPRGTLVGVDRARRQVEEARAIATATGLGNVRFVEASFEDAGELGGPFDYVIAHGVASWVPPASRRALLTAIHGALAPAGVAYVSFNVLPGWYERLAARDWLTFDRAEDAQASLAWLRDQVSPEHADYRRRLGAVARRLGETERAYAAHEYLADEHHPQPVSALLREAASAGLAYLGDAIPGEMAVELLPAAARERAHGLDPAAAQQLVDFVRNTAFRRAVLVRADEAAARAWRWPPELKAEALEGLRMASRLREAAETGKEARLFHAPDVSVQVEDATTRRALRELGRVAPLSLAFPELAARVDAKDLAALQQELLELWLATGAVDVHAHEPPLVVTPGERPLACPVARWHAVSGGAVTSRWHAEVQLEEPLLRQVLALLDGSRTLDGIARTAGCALDTARACAAALGVAGLLEA
jgi:hypothetical protein